MPDFTQTDRLISISTPLGEDELLLKSIRGTERLGELFSYEALLYSEDNNIDYKKILGKEVTVTINSSVTDGGTRYIHGIVRSFGRTGSTGILTNYTAIIVPKLWLTTLTVDCRIFQKKSAKTIVSDLVKTDAGISDFKDSASDSGDAERPYTVQFRETDFAFVSRLLEEEGIYYHFEHAEGKHTIVLCDAPGSHSDAPSADKVSFHNNRILRSEHGILTWDLGNEVLPGNYVLADYNYQTPATVLRSNATEARGHAADDAEIFDYPGFYLESAEGDKRAKNRLGAHQSLHSTYHGTTTAITLATGLTFTLEDHPLDALNQKYLVVENEIFAQNAPFTGAEPPDDEVFESRLVAIPATQRYIHPRSTPAPDLRGIHSAVVTGAEGDEIHTDKYGCVKVRFHWDRDDDKKGEDSTVYLRTVQMWTGSNWGTVFIPRVGQEVVVQFLDGCPDRPVITGCLYNEANMPPYELPEHKTRSTIKTRSTPEGEQYNEIRFEDKKDEEQLFIHAAKEHDTIVAHDQSNWVGNDRREFIVHDHEHVTRSNHVEHIGGNHHVIIGAGADATKSDTGEDVDAIDEGGGQHIEIIGPHATEIGGTSSTTVEDDVSEKYNKNHATEVTEQRYLKAKEIILEAEENITFRIGDKTTIAMTADGVQIKTQGDVAIETDGDISSKATGNIAQKATGDHKSEATGNMELKGTAGLKAESTANVEVKATAQLKLAGTAGFEAKGATAKVAGDGMAEISGGGMCTVKGGIVMIN